MATQFYGDVSLDRMVSAVEKVRQRLLRAAAALEKFGVSYAFIAGNAVAAWVSRVDEAAVRNTQDVDILLRHGDLDAAAQALEQAGFIRRHVSDVGLVDSTWISRLLPPLQTRLKELLDNPEG